MTPTIKCGKSSFSFLQNFYLDIVPVKKQDTLAGIAAFERSLSDEGIREGVVCCLEHENNDKSIKSSNECPSFHFSLAIVGELIFYCFLGMNRILSMQTSNIFFQSVNFSRIVFLDSSVVFRRITSNPSRRLMCQSQQPPFFRT